MAREGGSNPEEYPHHRGGFKRVESKGGTKAAKGQQEKDQKVSTGFSDTEVLGALLKNCGKSQIAVGWETNGNQELGMASVENSFKMF